MGGVGVVAPEKLAEFYRDLHEYLAAAGVDGVKVDGQAVVGGLGQGSGGGPQLAKSLHRALEASVTKHFPTNGLINCMCHSSENILNFSGSALARVSDDFYPGNNASHTVHIANVAYNSVFMGEIVLPDWDMFHSRNEAGELHAAARAVGGCPVYVSDAPGRHDFGTLRQLVFPSGRVLRAELPGRPTRDCLFADVTRDGVTALKVWNKNKRGGVVGCFNIQGSCWSRDKGIFVSHAKVPPNVTAVVRLRDVEGILDDYPHSGKQEETKIRRGGNERQKEKEEGGGTRGGVTHGVQYGQTEVHADETVFAVQAHRTHGVRLLRVGEAIEITLKPKEWEVYTVAPVLRVGPVSWSPIALDQMFNGGGAVMDAGLLDVGRSVGRTFDRSVGGGGGGGAEGARGAGQKEKNMEREQEEEEEGGAAAAAAAGAAKVGGPSTGLTGTARVYGCGVLVCYSSVKPSAVTVDGFVCGKYDWTQADGCLMVWLGTTEGVHEVCAEF